jgi:hypothetical protein
MGRHPQPLLRYRRADRRYRRRRHQRRPRQQRPRWRHLSPAHPFPRWHHVRRFRRPHRCRTPHLRLQTSRRLCSGLPWRPARRCRSCRPQNRRPSHRRHCFHRLAARPLQRWRPVGRFPPPRRPHLRLQRNRRSRFGRPLQAARRCPRSAQQRQFPRRCQKMSPPLCHSRQQ